MKICIDAGHNYSDFDTGTYGNGLREENVTFEIADKLKNYLHSVGIQTIMTRPMLETNVGYNMQTSLDRRAQIANDSNCDYFVSIHCNSSTSKSAWGTETLICNKGGKAEELAEAIQHNIVNKVGTTDRGVRVDKEYLGYDLAVLNKTNMPAVLVETAFISNESDALLLKNNTMDFALSIFWGICDFLGIHTQTKDDGEMLKDLETVNDIVWELKHRGIITNPTLWLSKLQNDENSYWLARKCANYIRGLDV